jgi:transcriptional regulator with XRE-family HTH domain
MNIKPYRDKMNISQAVLAERCELSQNHISQIERGKRTPSLKVIQKLCEVLGCTEAELLNGPADEGYKVILKYVHKIEEVQDEMTINGGGSVTLADDGTIIASHKGKLFSNADKDEALSCLSVKLDEALETVKRRAEKAKGEEARG